MAITTKSATVYHPGPLVAAPEGGVHERAPMPGPDMKNAEIEATKVRRRLAEDIAKICVAVMPGDEHIGDVYVNVQFEGRKGLHDPCMQGHNELLTGTARVLKDIFDELGGDWEATLASQPCPTTSVSVALQRAQTALEVGLDLELDRAASSAAVSVEHEVNVTVGERRK